ncbi:MAG: diaminopimelate decarboxylase [Clostridia bacterium]
MLQNLGVNASGNLTIGNVDTVSLAKKYGTPLYLLDEQVICDNVMQYKNAIDKYYNKKGLVLYASKAFSSVYIYRLINTLGIGIDVVSGGELYTALKAGFDTSKIYFHGNNKSYDELLMAMQNDVEVIVVDNENELSRLNSIAVSLNKKQKILLRITPGIDAHTHDFVKTGNIDSKFGFTLENGDALRIIGTLSKYENLIYEGLHCHIGSQIFDVMPFVEASNVMLKLAKDIKDEFGYVTKKLNLGGGFGIKYVEGDDPIEYESYIEKVSQNVKKLCKEFNLEMPFIIMEPGRSIIGPAGITLYTVGNTKIIPNIRNYVSVDGGMSDNPRFALYGSKYECLIANKASENKTTDVYTVAGKHCESGDFIAENIKLQTPEYGDILAVLATGAYNYSMASNYNMATKPPVVVVSNGEDKLVIRRETFEDLLNSTEI